MEFGVTVLLESEEQLPSSTANPRKRTKTCATEDGQLQYIQELQEEKSHLTNHV